MSSETSYKKIHDMKVEADVGLTMSDGIRLSARVYRPAGEGKYPVLLAVSPYQHETDSIPHSTLFLWREVGPVGWYVEAQGYVIVHVDVRGTGLSQGDYHLLDKREHRLGEVVEHGNDDRDHRRREPRCLHAGTPQPAHADRARSRQSHRSLRAL